MSVTIVNPDEPAAQSEPVIEAVETQTEAAVEIAQIEAARDIALAEINAETTETIVQHEAAERDEEDRPWREQLANVIQSQAALSERVERLAEQTDMILTRLTPPEPEPPRERSQENLDPPRNEPAPEPEPGPEPEPPPVRKKAHRWI